MILNPAIIALLGSAFLISLMFLYASFYGFRIIRHWDIKSGSELQLRLERSTYLISVILSYVLVFQLGSLFLFIFTAEKLHTLFVGAMCAAGTLQANSFGYPALILKSANFLIAFVWLVINHTDSRATDYPYTKVKYALLLVLAPLVLVESALLILYISGLDPDVITSCCGTIFNEGTSGADLGLGTGLASFDPHASLAVYLGSIAVALALGAYAFVRGRAHVPYSAVSMFVFLSGIVAMVSCISPYVYELPTHHCPFCVLQAEYGYVGYVFYLTLLLGAGSGLGAGALGMLRKTESLAAELPSISRRLVAWSAAMFAANAGMTIYLVWTSNLVM